MKANKLIIILVLTLLIGAGAVYLFNEQKKEVVDQEFGQEYLSGLSGKINDVNRIVVQDDSSTVTLLKNESAWVVEEKSAYPADFTKVKTLLVSLADMETIESKTSRTESYGRLGVQGVGQPGEEQSKQIKLLDKADNLLYSIIIGKEKRASGPGGKPAIYVRKENDETSWLVMGSVRLPGSAVDWLNNEVINIDKSRIQSVVIKHSDNTSLSISKNENADTDYMIEDQPKGTVVKSSSALNNMANSLKNLTFDDVVVRGKFDVDEKTISKIDFKTFDDLLISAKLAKKDDKDYIWFDVKSLNKESNGEVEAQEFNNAFALWVYQIPNFKAEGMLKNMNDLVEKKAEEQKK